MGQIWRTTWRHLRRSPYHALAAIAVMTLTSFIISVFVLSAAGSQKLLLFFEKKPQVIAFLKDEATKGDVDALTLKLLSTGRIDGVTYVSKEEALKAYQEQNSDDPLLLEMVSAEILPASLEVATKEIDYLEEAAKILADDPQVEEVSFQRDVIEVLQKITRGIRIGGLSLIVFLLAVSLLVVLVVVGLKAALHRREVKIMRVLGASRRQIRSPFFWEGVFYGGLGAFFGWGGAYLLLLYATPSLLVFLNGLSLLPVPPLFMFLLLAGLLFLGMLVGGLASLIAVRRYLR